MSAGSDYKWQLNYALGQVENDLSFQVNAINKLEIGYHAGNAVGDTLPSDPIDSVAYTRINNNIDEFRTMTSYAPITVISEREMHLILAEAALTAQATLSITRSRNISILY